MDDSSSGRLSLYHVVSTEQVTESKATSQKN
jgi:hypothetical protein